MWKGQASRLSSILRQSPHLRVCVITCILARAALFTGVLRVAQFWNHLWRNCIKDWPSRRRKECRASRRKMEEIRPMASLSIAITLTMNRQPVISQAPPMWWAEAKFANWGVKTWEGRVKKASATKCRAF